MTDKLPTEQDLQFLNLKGGCRGSSKSTLVKIPHCLKSHVHWNQIIRRIRVINYFKGTGANLAIFPHKSNNSQRVNIYRLSLIKLATGTSYPFSDHTAYQIDLALRL